MVVPFLGLRCGCSTVVGIEDRGRVGVPGLDFSIEARGVWGMCGGNGGQRRERRCRMPGRGGGPIWIRSSVCVPVGDGALADGLLELGV